MEKAKAKTAAQEKRRLRGETIRLKKEEAGKAAQVKAEHRQARELERKQKESDREKQEEEKKRLG